MIFMEDDGYLGKFGLVLLGLVLLLIFLPIVIGVGISLLTGATGIAYYTVVILVAVVMWLLLGILFWSDY